MHVSIIAGITTGAINGNVKLMQERYINVLRKGTVRTMTNNERENKIFEVLQLHHNKVKQHYHVIMTVLCGSQNYSLDMPTSDYDTYTFVLPAFEDLAMLKDAVSTLTEDEYGHINIKDLRLALNLLKKTSPNSVEWFASKYRVIEPEYKDLIEQYITPEALRCSAKHMMDAISGMAHQLTKRNMSPGKQYAHLLRMECMVDNYYNLQSDILSLTNDKRSLAYKVKTLSNISFFNGWCTESEQRVREKIESYQNIDMSTVEKIGLLNVNQLQMKLFQKYVASKVL